MLFTRIAEDVVLVAAIGTTRYHRSIFIARQLSCHLAVEGGAQGCYSHNPRQHAVTAAPDAQFFTTSRHGSAEGGETIYVPLLRENIKDHFMDFF